VGASAKEPQLAQNRRYTQNPSKRVMACFRQLSEATQKLTLLVRALATYNVFVSTAFSLPEHIVLSQAKMCHWRKRIQESPLAIPMG